MKEYIKILIITFGCLFFSCEEEVPSIGPVPDSFTKKVLIEEFTGAWCGYCPDGAHRLENTINANNGNVIGVSLHNGDQMSVEHTDYLGSVYQNTGFPSGMVDRIAVSDFYGNLMVSMNRVSWDYFALDQLGKVANCGLAIKSEVSGSKANVEVRVGFNASLIGSHKLSVYLIEDKVSGEGYGYDQSNYYDTDSNSPFYQLGNPIVGYEHNHTLRAILSEQSGDTIDPSYLISGGEFINTYTTDISSYIEKNLSVVAFVTHIGSSFTDHEVMNVQSCEINSLQDWD